MKTDTQMQIDVREEIKWDSRVTPTDIGVSVKEGVVTLSGTVTLALGLEHRRLPV